MKNVAQFEKSMVDEAKRIKTQGHRKPLSTFTEMAEEFGIPTQTLNRLIGHHHGPKPKTKGARNSYYDADEMRAWWKELKYDQS